ncbi:MAG: hypothetical protein ACRC92_20645 [Peptostreptococcaceae bacterium]
MSKITNIKNAFYRSIHLKNVPDLSKLGLEEAKHKDSYFLCQDVPFYENLPSSYGGIGTHEEIKQYFNKETFFEDIYVKGYSISRDANGNMRGLITAKPHTATLGLHIDNTKYMAADILFRFSSKGRNHYETMQLMSERKYQIMFFRSTTEKTSVTEEEMQSAYRPGNLGFTIQNNDLKYNSFVRTIIVDRRIPEQNTPWVHVRIDNNGVEERLEDLVIEVLFMTQMIDSEALVVQEALDNFIATDSTIKNASHSWPYSIKSISYNGKRAPFFSTYTPNLGYSTSQIIDFRYTLNGVNRTYEIELDLNLSNGCEFYVAPTDMGDKIQFRKDVEAGNYSAYKLDNNATKATVTLTPDTNKLGFCIINGGESTFTEAAESFCLLKSIKDVTEVPPV